jgi:hypothetical protein
MRADGLAGGWEDPKYRILERITAPRHVSFYLSGKFNVFDRDHT